MLKPAVRRNFTNTSSAFCLASGTGTRAKSGFGDTRPISELRQVDQEAHG